MKLLNYPDVESVQQTETVVIQEADPEAGKQRVELVIRDLPPDYGDILEAKLPTPKPPTLGPLKEKGQIVRDESGRPLMQYGWQDEAYLRRMREVGRLQSVLLFKEGVVPGQVEFDAREEDMGAEQYYAAILDEMKRFGFGLGQINKVAKAVRNLADLTDEDLEQARRDFTSRAGGAVTPGEA